MLIHYFLAGLKPIKIGQRPPISLEDLEKRGLSCLDKKVLSDFEKLLSIKKLDRAIRKYFSAKNNNEEYFLQKQSCYVHLDHFFQNEYYKKLKSDCPITLRRLSWQMLIEESHSKFLRAFATEAVNFFESLGALMAIDQKISKEEFKEQLAGGFDSTAKYLEKNYESIEVLLNKRHAFVKKLRSKLAEPNPLEAEQFIAEYFFKLADSLAPLDQFHPDHAFVYVVKYFWAEHIYSMNEDEGLKILQSMIKDVRNEAKA